MTLFNAGIRKILALLFPVLLPICHITLLWHYWAAYAYPVDTYDCDCTCWDTIFKGLGPYEEKPTSYKHFYFNATKNMAKIWIILSAGVIVLYESCNYLIYLGQISQLRWTMLFLFILSVFPHYYTWWSYINFYNDDYYDEWRYQMWFNFTEIMSTIIILYVSNAERKLDFLKVLIITGIGIMHIIAGSFDQLIVNIWYKKGTYHQTIRDFGLLVAALFQIILPLEQFRRECVRSNYYIEERKIKIRLFITFICIVCGCTFATLLY